MHAPIASLEDRVADLTRANAELEAFAEKVGHDLCEPLRGIKLITEFLREDCPGMDPGAAARVARLGELAAKTGKLVKGLLEHARAGTVELDLADTDLGGLAAEQVHAIRERGGAAEAEIVIAGPLPVALCDGLMIGRVLGTLIDNGLRYNRSRPKRVEIGSMSPGSAGVTVSVRDNGIGIDRTRQGALFRVLTKLHDPAEFGVGAGAGLAVARRIVERHGGRIWAESEPGRGSTFFFSLPHG